MLLKSTRLNAYKTNFNNKKLANWKHIFNMNCIEIVQQFMIKLIRRTSAFIISSKYYIYVYVYRKSGKP